jgi:hypothetical protein
VLTALTIAGPGRLSVDGLLGIRVPRWIGFAALAGTFGALWYGAREELEQGLSAVTAGGGEAAGDPSTDGTAREVRDAAATGGTGIGVMDIEAMDLPASEAGSAMGSGGALGSETPAEA